MTSIRKYNDRLKLHKKNKFIDIINTDFQKIEKVHREKTENSVKCSCGKSVTFPANIDKCICTWCGRTVINTTKNHFKYIVRKRLNTNVIEKRGEFK